MQTFTEYSAIPPRSAYLGSEYPDGSQTEELADLIDRALDPIKYRDPEGTAHYFDRIE